jgi:hypothetical protein
MSQTSMLWITGMSELVTVTDSWLTPCLSLFSRLKFLQVAFGLGVQLTR